MTIPLHLQMEIDIHAGLHQREIAEGFAKLRRKLLPSTAASVFIDCLANDTQGWQRMQAQLQGRLIPTGYLADHLQAANCFNPYFMGNQIAPRSLLDCLLHGY